MKAVISTLVSVAALWTRVCAAARAGRHPGPQRERPCDKHRLPSRPARDARLRPLQLRAPRHVPRRQLSLVLQIAFARRPEFDRTVCRGQQSGQLDLAGLTAR